MFAGGRRGDKQSTASRCRISCKIGFHSLVDSLLVPRLTQKSGLGNLMDYFVGTLRTSAITQMIRARLATNFFGVRGHLNMVNGARQQNGADPSLT